MAKYRFASINAYVLLQVEAAYDCLASIAANGLLQVDAASPTILRLTPTAAAEWAKPREIRRGTRLSTAGAGGA